MKPEHSYYDYLPRALLYCRAAQLSNDALALYYAILIEYNSNYYKPVAVPEVRLQNFVGCSHKSFIKYRKQLLEHRLITVRSDGVNAAVYTAELPPRVASFEKSCGSFRYSRAPTAQQHTCEPAPGYAPQHAGLFPDSGDERLAEFMKERAAWKERNG